MSCFIVADDEAVASRIRAALASHKLDCPRANVLHVQDAVSRLGREKGVDAVIVAVPPDPAAALELLVRLAPLAGSLLAVGPTGDARFVLQALRAGVRDYLDRTDLEAELTAAIQRLSQPAKSAQASGRVVAVLAPSGGAGSSTVAANLAAALAAEHHSAGLVDLKVEAGDLAALLDLKPTYTLADLCKNASSFDRVMLERSFVRHESGASLLAPPARLADAPLVRAEGVARAIDMARSLFPFVVVDVDHTFREEQVAALRQADVILMVFRLEFSSLRNVQRTLEHLARLGVGGDRVRLVVNRAGLPLEVPASKAEEALGAKVAHSIPDDPRAVARSNNSGVPVVVEAPTSRAAKSLVQLAHSLDSSRRAEGAAPEDAAKAGWLPWRRRAVAMG